MALAAAAARAHCRALLLHHCQEPGGAGQEGRGQDAEQAVGGCAFQGLPEEGLKNGALRWG